MKTTDNNLFPTALAELFSIGIQQTMQAYQEDLAIEKERQAKLDQANALKYDAWWNRVIAIVPEKAIEYVSPSKTEAPDIAPYTEIEINIPGCAPIHIFQVVKKVGDNEYQYGPIEYRVLTYCDFDDEYNIYWRSNYYDKFTTFERALVAACKNYDELSNVTKRIEIQKKDRADYLERDRALEAAIVERKQEIDGYLKTGSCVLSSSTNEILITLIDRLTAIAMILQDK